MLSLYTKESGSYIRRPFSCVKIKHMSNSGKQLKLGALISYFSIFFGAVTALVYTPWMERQIGQSNYALYNLAFSFISLFLVDFGLDTATSRYIAKYRAEGNEDKINAAFSLITKLYLIIDTVIFIALFVMYWFIGHIYQGLTPAEITVFRRLYLMIAVFSVISFPFTSLSGILMAYEEFVPLKLCDFGRKIVSVLLIVWMLLHGFGVVGLVGATICSGLLFIGIRWMIIRKKTPVRLRLKTRDPELMKSLLGFSVWTAVISLSSRASFTLAPTILGIVSDSEQIAIFSPANFLEGYFFLLASAVNGLFLARISNYIAAGEEHRIQALMIKIGRYQLAVMGLIFIGFACVGQDFMLAWMGERYIQSARAAFLIFIPDLLLFTQQIANTAIIAKNMLRPQAVISVIAAVVCVLLSVPLSQRYGAIGACLAIAVSYMISFLYMNHIYADRLHIDIPLFFRKCYGSFLLPYLLTYGLYVFLLKPLLPFGGWKGLALKIVVISLLYGGLLWAMGLNAEEKKYIRHFLPHKQK